MNTDNATRKTMSTCNLKLNGWPVVNTKLTEYVAKLSYSDREELSARMAQGTRFVVFHIDGDRVTLAEVEPAGMVVV